MNRDEKRELLRLRIQLLRLQIAAEQIKQHRELARFGERSDWVEMVPSAAVLWKLFKPLSGSKWRWLPFLLWLLKRWRSR